MNTAMEFSTTYHFADDTIHLYSYKSIDVLRKRLNKDLALLYNWLCANRLSLNAYIDKIRKNGIYCLSTPKLYRI